MEDKKAEMDVPKENPQKAVVAQSVELHWDEQEMPTIPSHWLPLFPFLFLIASFGMMFFMWDDLSYFWQKKIVSLGSAEHGCSKETNRKMKHNLFVSIDHLLPQPNMASSARTQFSTKSYLVPMGCDLMVEVDSKWYELFRKQGKIRFSSQGRLMQIFQVPNFENIRNYYGLGFEFTKDSYLLVDRDEPYHHRWILWLYLFLLGIVLFSLWKLKKTLPSWWQKDTNEE